MESFDQMDIFLWRRCARLDPPDRPGCGKYGMGGGSGWLFELE